METNFDAEENSQTATPEPPAEPLFPDAAVMPPLDDLPGTPDDAALPVPEMDELATLAEASVKARLAVPDEERLTELLKETLLGGRAGVARCVELLPTLPWIVAVRAVEQVWPELTPGFRTQLLSGLAKDEADAARRIRLSLARALFRLEVPVALKLALGVLKDLRDKETGGLTPRNAQIVSNVFIGRGKPWLAQLPLAELKPAEIELLVHCAVLAVFTVPHPPVTQLGVLKWAQEAERLDKLQDPALEVAIRAVARWSAKWQQALRTEIPALPEAIASVLKPASAEAPVPEAEVRGSSAAADDLPSGEQAAVDEEEDEDEDKDEEDGDEPVRKERPVYEPRPQKAVSDEPPRGRGRDRDAQRERPVYTPRNGGEATPVGRSSGRNFNLGDTLKGIEAHVQALRGELSEAQAKLRQREELRPRRAEKTIGPIIEGEPTPEELARLNQQLEARNLELQSRIEELTQHSEDVAASLGVISGEPVTDTAAQLRTLLGFKLQEHFADFAALEQESNDIVVRQHYREVMRQVFEVLIEAQVPLQADPAGSITESSISSL